MSVTAMRELYRAGGRPTSGFCRRYGCSAGNFVPDTSYRRVDVAPGWLVRGKLPPQVGGQFGDLTVRKTVLEGRHVAEVAGSRFLDSVQNDLDQVVRMGAVQVAVQRQ